MQISIKDMEAYKAGAELRLANDKKQLSERYRQAWKIAEKGAELLKNEFNVKKVILFGSLIQKELFHMKSDVDLAVEELDEKLYYRAVSRLLDLDSDIQTDLVMKEDASESLLKTIENKGIII
ncbi:Nucleotidyltransferase domain-containing protein [Desulfonema limicola]|uniref:Nucleotidyltransferase domain-containing protein n=1 Tax=Desulfonema limicola TaxID=45656 RepID=A0A975GH25_9BACT|nr:nucleotidyltransferase domain-containing protein [Desulfonema limicola]QTA80847.1 Nucleotidyltransferase domain-containing protein [Desulfonema limicola]